MAHLLFLSHAGADTERAVRLAAAIEASPDAQAAGLKVWVDKRPDGPHRLHAGTPWQDQLEVAIASHSTSFGLLLTREGARNWVRLEVRVALDRVIAEQRAGATYPFVPIIADDPGDLAHLPPFAQQYQGVRLTDNGQGLADLVRVAARLDTAQPIRLVAQPYMGLEAFEAKDAALFFGRRAETQALVDRLRTTNLVLVTGDSGSGKSSLVKAGLIPAFREGALADPLGRPEPGQWHVVDIRPGSDPFESLVEGVGKAASDAGKSLADQGILNDWIRTRDPDKIRDALRQSGPSGASLLLVVDQFEELWTLTTDDAKRRDFLAALLALGHEGNLARRVVGTMRRDYYHLHTDDERLRDRLAAHGNAGRFLLGAMAPEDLRDIVEKPLLLAGESKMRAAALADEVVKDVAGEPGNLALVEMALYESWERRHENGGNLALAYQRLDRLEGALARAADEVFWNPTNDPKKLTERERSIAEILFMRLVRAGDTGGGTRRPAAFAELEELARAVARKLAMPECRRLLVLREHYTGENDEDTITVELAHEQLITQWPDYRFWLRGTATTRHNADPERAVDKRTFDRLMDAAANWSERGCSDEDLARGGELADFQWMCRTAARYAWLSPLEREFMDRSSVAGRAAELERQQQIETLHQLAKTRRQQTWGAVSAALLLLLAAGVAIWQSHAAAERLAVAQRIDSQRLMELSLQATNRGDAVTGILLALQGLPSNLKDPERPLVTNMWQTLQSALSRQQEIGILYHDSMATSVAFSPDGTRIATGSALGTVSVWTLKNDSDPLILGERHRMITSLSFSPDSKKIATGSSDGTVFVRPIDKNEHTLEIPVQQKRLSHSKWSWGGSSTYDIKLGVNSVAFSPDGARVAIGYSDGSTRIWSVGDVGEPLLLSPHKRTITSVVFSHDGKKVAVSSDDRTVTVSRADNGDPLFTLSNGDSAVASVAFSPDSTRIATGGTDGMLRVWSADGVRELFPGRPYGQAVRSIAFSPDGASILSGLEDGTASILRAEDGMPLAILGGHDAAITSVAFHVGGGLIATASEDGTARIWLTDSFGAPLILFGHDKRVNSVAYSPDGTRIVTGSDDGTARIWHSNGIDEPLVLTKGDSAITAVAYSPNNIFVATGAEDGTSRRWRADGVGESVLLGRCDCAVTSITISPDGRYVVSGLEDGTARVWDAASGGEQQLLAGHEQAVASVSISPDGTHIATASADGSARIWRVGKGGEPIVIRDHTGRVAGSMTSVAFSPDGTQIVTGDIEGVVQLWKADGTEEPLRILKADSLVTSVSFSSDGTRIASGFDDGTVRVSLLRSEGPPVLLSSDDYRITSLAFNPNGESLVTGSDDNTAKIWPLVGTLEQIVAHAYERKLPRSLTKTQKNRYFIIDDW